jgi:hypothetical protein
MGYLRSLKFSRRDAVEPGQRFDRGWRGEHEAAFPLSELMLGEANSGSNIALPQSSQQP